jgi:hypothetical protein
MHDELYLDIKTFLHLEKTMSEQQRDLYLRDYHMAFRGASDDWSVPESQMAEYRALERQEKQAKTQAKTGLTVANIDFVVDENGGLIIRQSHNVIQISAQDRMAFQSALFKLPLRGADAGGPSTSFPGHSSAPVNIGNNHLENDDRPLVKERMDRSLAEMEKFAQASYGRYPKHT